MTEVLSHFPDSHELPNNGLLWERLTGCTGLSPKHNWLFLSTEWDESENIGLGFHCGQTK